MTDSEKITDLSSNDEKSKSSHSVEPEDAQFLHRPVPNRTSESSEIREKPKVEQPKPKLKAGQVLRLRRVPGQEGETTDTSALPKQSSNQPTTHEKVQKLEEDVKFLNERMNKLENGREKVEATHSDPEPKPAAGWEVGPDASRKSKHQPMSTDSDMQMKLGETLTKISHTMDTINSQQAKGQKVQELMLQRLEEQAESMQMLKDDVKENKEKVAEVQRSVSELQEKVDQLPTSPRKLSNASEKQHVSKEHDEDVNMQKKAQTKTSGSTNDYETANVTKDNSHTIVLKVQVDMSKDVGSTKQVTVEKTCEEEVKLVKPAEESQKENEMTSKSELVLGKEH